VIREVNKETTMKKMIAMFLMVAATVATAAEGEFAPKDVTAPSALLDLVDWFAGNRVVQIGSLTSVVVSVVSLLKALAPVLGAKLSGKAAYVLTSVVALLGVIGAAVSDGVLQGGEFGVVVTAIVAVILAPFGYRLLFSQTAKNEGAVQAAKTMFRKG
jgi:hypothetical protein